MKKILLFGAGKSATVLIKFLLQRCDVNSWQLIVVDADLALAKSKTGNNAHATAMSFDVHDAEKRNRIIVEADLVISLLPPALHLLVAQACLTAGKNLLTASYIDAGIEAMRPQIEAAGLLFLCEMGLDPGIDHMSAKKLLDEIQSVNGQITSFVSHCGGLVAKESDDNPWHYKVSWNPRNIVMAGKDGAVFRQHGKTVQWPYEQLFAEKRTVQINGDTYCWYPNRDSLRYTSVYGLDNCPTFIRTTLRHPDFISGWKHIIELGLTEAEPMYETDNMTLQSFFQQHFKHIDFDRWLQQKLVMNLVQQEQLLEQYNSGAADGAAAAREQTSVKLQQLLYESGLVLDQLSWLGINDRQTTIDRGRCSAAEVLQFVLEKKLALQPSDRDLVVMLHEIEYTQKGKRFRVESALVQEGNDDTHTAMASTVGLPLGIAAMLILEDELQLTGLHIPVLPQIYLPVLAHLEKEGIRLSERKFEVS